YPVGKGGAPMPYCMFFHGGYALHGSNSVPSYNASHGCVRMAPEDAQWLNEDFVQEGVTQVVIHY
ncbi:MAG TPA: L,D-transpeptidase, partial [Candidatus Berkiella sp.]|nr:L,D-transpeptidase [Candidatus Berkiella sp.]